MQIILKEDYWNNIFIDTCKLYKEIIERLYLKTTTQANNKVFAKKYFLEYLEAELNFHKGYPFNGDVIDYFQIAFNLGFSWAKFFKEVRVMQKIYTYDENNTSIVDYAKFCAEFTPQERKRIVLESKVLNENREADCLYRIIRCALLHKNREVDFIKYVAKYKTMFAFVQQLRNTYKSNDVNNTNIIGTNNKTMRWNGAKGKKIELIRLLVALNDCKYFETDSGLVPSQGQLMNYFSEMLCINLKHFEQDLSNGFESKLQTNTALFDKLKMAIEKRYQQKIEQN